MSKRVYVRVIVEYEPDGRVIPKSIQWGDGRVYEVDRLLDTRLAAATKAGGHGTRYTCRIMNKEAYLFEDEGRWFVESRDA